MTDAKLALRQLLKDPGFIAVAVITLAFGFKTHAARAAEPAAATTSDRIELIDIGGRKLQLLTRGEGSPTVVIEAGLGEPPIESGSWRVVLDAISRSNRVCLYDRAGLGKSDPPPKLPRTSRDVAEDLNALLVQGSVPGPYLLVGHSWAGNLVTRADPAGIPEQIDFRASEAQVRNAGGLGDKPLVILSHSSKFRYDPSLPEDVSLKFEEIAQQLQADLKRLSSNSRHRQSINGGHYLHAEDPELAIQGIRQALDAVKQQHTGK